MVELEKLEREVREMAKKISEYRNTLPDHLSNTLDIASGSDPMPSSSERLAIPPETQAAPLTRLVGSEEEECEEKMVQLKDIVSRNAENISKAVKRVRECVERIHRLDSLDKGTRRTIHPAFTRRRIN